MSWTSITDVVKDDFATSTSALELGGGLDITSTLSVGGRTYGTNKILWSGGYYMHASQSITFSESATDQPNGLVFVFDEYTNGAARNQGYWCRFIPKTVISTHSGKFFQFCEPKWSGSGTIAVKGMWLSPTGASGHACSAYTTSPYASTSYILRYVIGV